jgi:hypothetical protein
MNQEISEYQHTVAAFLLLTNMVLRRGNRKCSEASFVCLHPDHILKWSKHYPVQLVMGLTKSYIESENNHSCISVHDIEGMTEKDFVFPHVHEGASRLQVEELLMRVYANGYFDEKLKRFKGFSRSIPICS